MAGPDGAALDGRTSRALPRRRILRRYITLFAVVITTALLVSGISEIWFGYRDEVASLERIQRGQAQAAADRIEEFVTEIERQTGWTTHLPWTEAEIAGAPAAAEDPLAPRRLDALRLQRQVPAIAEISLVDPDGQEQLRVSRIAMDVVRSGIDLSQSPAFVGAVENGAYFGPVYFRRESEPYMTIAVAGSRRANGVSIVEVNLKLILDLISAIEVGEGGHAYVIDASGRLVSHPDISLVLRNTDMTVLPQVRGALGLEGEDGGARALDGMGVVTAHASIPDLGWTVFVELPMREALGPIYASVARTGGLLLLGLGLAFAAAILFARRMVVPIKELQQGASRIGQGAFDGRIRVSTGDELEALAEAFNDMAVGLRRSQAELERRVEERTQELGEKSRQLALVSQHKSQFLANMSHELRTPLNAVLGYTELMLDNIYGELSPRAREVLERVQVNGKHLLQMINDVLDLSRIESGELSLTIDAYRLDGIVTTVASGMESIARAKGIEIRTLIPAGLPSGRGDERRITQVLLNLVGNALKFTDEGYVEITLAVSDNVFDIVVRDTGPGIAPEDQERIFREFQQVDSSTSRSKGGSGLGLAITRRLVASHRGSISVESALGKGAVFRVRLPVAIDDVRVAA
ncbi:MAG: sensor histidine kinase [Bauldia sp.]